MKTLFAANVNLATTIELLSVEELSQVKGGFGPGSADLYWDDDLNTK